MAKNEPSQSVSVRRTEMSDSRASSSSAGNTPQDAEHIFKFFKTTGNEKLYMREFMKNVANDEKLLEQMVSANVELFTHAVSKCRRRDTITERVRLDPDDFVMRYKGDLYTRMHEAFHSTLFDYVDEDEERAKTLCDTETKKEAYELFQENFKVRDFFASAENALQEVFEDFEKDISKEFLIPKYGELRPTASKKKAEPETKKNETKQSKKPSAQHPSPSRPVVKMYSPNFQKPLDKNFFSSSEEEDGEDENDEEGEQWPDENVLESSDGEDLEATQAPNANMEEEQTTTPKQKKKRRLSKSSSGTTTGKKKRGRPKKGPDMDLVQGLHVLLYDDEIDEWKEVHIAPKSSDTTISMTAARRALSAGKLRPLEEEDM